MLASADRGRKSRVSGRPKSGNEIWGAKRPKFEQNLVRNGQIWSCGVLRDDGRRRELGSSMSGVPGRIRVIHGSAFDHNRPSTCVLGFENGNYGQRNSYSQLWPIINSIKRVLCKTRLVTLVRSSCLRAHTGLLGTRADTSEPEVCAGRRAARGWGQTGSDPRH